MASIFKLLACFAAILLPLQCIAQQILPATLTLGGKAYQILYDASTNSGSAIVMLHDPNGIEGAGILRLESNKTTGQLTVGSNQYAVNVTPAGTTVTAIAAPPEPRPGTTDCLTNNLSTTKALLGKLAKTRANAMAPDGLTTVNIAVLYTPAAVKICSTASNMVNLIQQAIVEANDSYVNSGVNVQLNLVYTGPLNYTEVVPGSLVNDLYAIEGNAQAQALRAQYGADVVSVMLGSTDPLYSGMSGGYNGDPAHAYNVVQAWYAVGNFVLAHEVGHNFGCDHDRANICYNAAFPYSYGSRFMYNSTQFRTVMAYSPGIQVGRFSGPNVTFYGAITGSTNEDNARTINQIAPIVATFHAPIPTNTLTLARNGTGTVAQDGVVNTSGAIYATVLQKINLTASGNFVCWTGATNTAQNSITLQITQSTNLTANFADGSTYIAPLLTQQPQSLIEPTGSAASLSTTGYGVPPPTFQWTHNGTNYGTGNTLNFSSLAPEDQGAYQCILFNFAGSVTSAVATVIEQLPAITREPASLMVLTNTAASFTFQFSDPTGITWQWYFNSVAIPKATNATYTIANVKLTNAGTFYAVAAHGVLSASSSNADLLVNVPPSFQQQPADVVASVGQTANLSACATGSGLAYQWQRNSNSIPGATSPTLTLNNLQTTNSGTYRLRASNPIATVYSDSATLTAMVPLAITQPLTNTTALLGASPTLKLVVTGSAPAYQWFLNGDPLDTPTNGTCKLVNVQTNQAGLYSVTIFNLVSAITNSATLTVLDPPVITQQPTPVIADAGGSASFSVAADGRAPFSYAWYQNGNGIPGGNSPTLNLANLTAANAGAYHVIVANSDGAARSYLANLALNDAPGIIVQPKNTTVTNGANAEIYVGATGAQPLTYYWYEGNTLLTAGSSPALVIPFASLANEDSYSVSVSNWLGGITSTSVNLYVSSPPTITSQPAGCTLPAGQPFTLTLTASGRSPMTYLWKQGSNVVSVGTDDNPNYTIDSLQTNYSGTYTVTVTNVDGSATSAKAVVSVISTPSFVQQPTNRTVNVNSNVTLSAKVTPAAVSYQWYDNNGDAIPWGTTNSLTCTNIQLSQAGSYNLTASNLGGTTNSTNVFITVLDPPVWIQQPGSQTVFTNDTLSLTGIAGTSAENINYQWLLGNNPIPGATDNTYTITVADKTCLGNYTLLAWNDDGTNTSKAAVVTWIKQPPVLTGPLPGTIIVAVGEPLQITLPLGGYDPTGMQWYLNGIALPGQNGNPFGVDSFAANLAGNYTACITNADGYLNTRDHGSITVISRMAPPVITVQPATQTVAAGNDATFSVTCATQNGLSYQWMQNRIPLDGQNGPTLTLGGVQDANAGNYSVVVTGNYGSTASKTANLYVMDPPTIVTQPKELLLAIGAGGTLAVKATCNYGSIQYQWQFNGNNISGATNSSYTIGSATQSRQGTYQVLVYNAAGTNVSNPASVTTTQIPVITTQPANITCQPGDAPTFSVTATGRGTLTYQWFYAGVPIPGQTDTSLNIDSAQLYQTNGYLVNIRNEDGSVNSATVHLTVVMPPTITSQPVSQTIAIGQTLSLSCTATGPGGSLYYHWYKNGVPIGGATGAAYSIAAANTTFQGIYYVIVTNLEGVAQSDPASITVLSPPAITTQPASQTVTLGDPAQISVVASGSQPLTCFWMKNGLWTPASSSSAFCLDSVTSSDLGSYYVIVSNSVGMVTSKSITLSAATNGLPPGIIAQPQNQTVPSGKTATFSVKAAGQAPLAYQWFANDNPLAGQTNSTLSIANLNDTNVGQLYYVVITNRNGAIESDLVTTALNPVPTPPGITDQPSTATAAQYQTLDIAMSTTDDAYRFTWYKNGALYATTSIPELIVNNATTNLNAKFTMVAYNGALYATSAPVVVTIYALPNITVQPAAKSLNLGSNATLSVTATGTGPLNYQWYDNNGDAIPWALTNTLILTNVQPADEGAYWVSVINSYGEADSLNANIWIKQPPVITSQPVGAVLNQDDPYTFSVSTTGHDPMTCCWYHNNVKMSDVSGSSLTISGVQSIDAGNYYAAITNVDGGIISSNATLVVTVPPYITATNITSLKVQVGTNCTLLANAGGSTPLAFQWFLNGTAINGANATNLVLTGITEAQEGTYCFAASNTVGNAFANITIVTVTDPPVITQQPVATAVSIGQPGTLTVAAGGRTPITYQWYKSTGLIDSGNALISGGNTPTISFTMTNSLAASYQVVLANADGTVTSRWASVTINTNASRSNGSKLAAITPAPAAAMTRYHGLFYENSDLLWAHSGTLTVSVLDTNYQGTLTIECISYPIQGSLSNHQAQTCILRDRQSTLGVVFDVNTNDLTGAVGDGTWTADIFASAESSTISPARTYNLWFNNTLAGTVEITNNLATLAAAFAGGTITQTCGLDDVGQWPFYSSAILGWLEATPTSLSGTAVWFQAGTNQTITISGKLEP